MNIAYILAGGTDISFPSDVPKQFVNVFNRPVIVYTLEIFQKHPEIDYIAVACLEGWQEMVRAYAKQYHVTKLKWIIAGGCDGQETSYNGIQVLKEECKAEDIIVIHDAIRPMVSADLISDSIRVCRCFGMGIAAVHSRDAIVKSSDGSTGMESINRYEIMRIQTPQSYRFDLLQHAHNEALEKGITGQWEVSGMLSKLGQRIYFSKGTDMNIKINTIEDVTMFKALYQMKNGDSNKNECGINPRGW